MAATELRALALVVALAVIAGVAVVARGVGPQVSILLECARESPDALPQLRLRALLASLRAGERRRRPLGRASSSAN